MRHKNINEVTHQWMLENLTDDSVVVDATMGNGHDTLFLSNHSKKVYAFDISTLAYNKTQKKVSHKDNVVLLLDSHQHMDNHVHQSIDGVVFNCGYLPNSDHTSVTNDKTTLCALDKAKKLLVKHGWICITVYVGHDGGKQEAKSVLNWLETNTRIEKTYTYDNVLLAPIAYFARLQ
mgnify:CR=1 FL=1